jgi:hypothetical protein
MSYVHIPQVLTPSVTARTRLPEHSRFLVRPQRLTRR